MNEQARKMPRSHCREASTIAQRIKMASFYDRPSSGRNFFFVHDFVFKLHSYPSFWRRVEWDCMRL